VSERTAQFEKERLGLLSKHFVDKPLLRFKAEDVAESDRAAERRHDGGTGG
jgi:hypothetical protein